MKPCHTSLLVLSALLLSGAALRAYAAPADVSKVDQVLDRLEKRLLDQEADGLTFGEKLPPPPSQQGDVRTFNYDKGTRIEARTPTQDTLKGLKQAVTELEGQVDQLASSVQKTKQAIVDDAAIDNYLTLEAQLSDNDAASLKTLNVKLDGYAIYELADTAGLWMPTKSIPLYAGPLQPGKHRIDLEARLVMRAKDRLPLNGDVYRFVNKTFDLTIPGGASVGRYVITITPPAKLSSIPEATLKAVL